MRAMSCSGICLDKGKVPEASISSCELSSTRPSTLSGVLSSLVCAEEWSFVYSLMWTTSCMQALENSGMRFFSLLFKRLSQRATVNLEMLVVKSVFSSAASDAFQVVWL